MSFILAWYYVSCCIAAWFLAVAAVMIHVLSVIMYVVLPILGDLGVCISVVCSCSSSMSGLIDVSAPTLLFQDPAVMLCGMLLEVKLHPVCSLVLLCFCWGCVGCLLLWLACCLSAFMACGMKPVSLHWFNYQ